MLALLMVRLPPCRNGWLRQRCGLTFAGQRRPLKNSGVFRDRWNRGASAAPRSLDATSAAPRRARRAPCRSSARTSTCPSAATARRRRVDDRLGEAAEVAVELLAVERDPAARGCRRAARAALPGETIVCGVYGRRPRARCSGPARRRRAARARPCRARGRGRWSRSAGSRPGHARHALAAAGERDDDLAGVRRREVDPLVRAREELVEQSAETGGGSRAPSGGTMPAARRSRWYAPPRERTAKPSWHRACRAGCTPSTCSCRAPRPPRRRACRPRRAPAARAGAARCARC